MSKKSEIVKSLPLLRKFVCDAQLVTLGHALRSEEKEYFEDMILSLTQRLKTIPMTYQQDGLGDEAIVYLHYFNDGSDWFITEKDQEEDQYQAFGFVSLGCCPDGAEAGYISIEELKNLNVELDLHWEERTLREAKERL